MPINSFCTVIIKTVMNMGREIVSLALICRMKRLLIFSALCLLLCSCGENHANVLANAGSALSSGNSQKAKDLYSKLLHSDPFDVDALRGMVSVAKISGSTMEQVRWCKPLLELYPWDRYANIMVGKQLMEEGNLKDAAVRLILADQSSEFKNDKQEVYSLLLELKKMETLQIQQTMSSHIQNATK